MAINSTRRRRESTVGAPVKIIVRSGKAKAPAPARKKKARS